jgi:hypothetical protein
MQGKSGSSSADFSAAKNEVTERLEHEKRTATEVIQGAQQELAEKVSEYAAEAKEAVTQQAEGVQQNISSNMVAFGGALRAASEHLANSDQRRASKFVLDAAGGLERLASSLKNKPLEEVLGEVRSFGRDNSPALIAGSVLAGLALGRFLKSSAPDHGKEAVGPEGRSNPSTSLNEHGSPLGAPDVSHPNAERTHD